MPREQAARSTARKPAPRSTYDADDHVSEPFDLDALSKGGPDIEVVRADKDMRAIMEDAKFMNEPVRIRFHEANDPNAPLAVEINISTRSADGKKAGPKFNKVLMRGKTYDVPRFAVEGMAHSKVTKLVRVEDARDPMNVKHVNKNAFYYPFEVIRDDNPKGRAWLDRVLADPA